MTGMKGKDSEPLGEEKDGRSPSGQGASRGRNFASELWGEVREGAEHFQSRKGHLPKGRVRQFFYGMTLPFHVARVTLANPAVRATYVKVTAIQTAFLLAIGAGWAFHEYDGQERRKRPETAETRAAKERAQARIEARAKELEAALKARKGQGAEQEDAAAVKNALSALIHEAVNSGKQGELPPDEAAAVAAEAAEQAEEAVPDTEDAEEESFTDFIQTEVESAFRDAVDVSQEEARGLRIQKEPQKKGFNIDAPEVRNGILLLGSWEFWALFFGSLSAVQWIVVALSRDYHTVISREASLATGVPPEDPDIAPRVRLNVPWMRAKLQRRIRAFLLFVMGFPALVLLCIPLCWFPKSFTLLSGAWGFWWLIVFTAAKSDRAWMAPVTRPPWFVRAWSRLPTHGALRWMMTGLARRSEAVAAPIAAVERQPWVFAGLALTRFVGSIPPFRCFTRPFIPVASSHLIGLDPMQPPALKKGESPPAHDAGD
ncbi:hypothetical protein D7X96_32885 [Corallococcus interemptor]|uniref:Uncharacterized protein n=3 Tax=Myxococcaceae TaxID=31 RepID=A0A3A8Q7N2_9BACT|nr:hypothetical protein D7X96_32885 [Corallococcus interemptor]